MGKAFCIGLLDYIDSNPVSRLIISPFKNIEGVKKDILSKNPIFIPKPEIKVEAKPFLKKVPTKKNNLRSQSSQRAIEKMNKNTSLLNIKDIPKEQ